MEKIVSNTGEFGEVYPGYRYLIGGDSRNEDGQPDAAYSLCVRRILNRLMQTVLPQVFEAVKTISILDDTPLPDYFMRRFVGAQRDIVCYHLYALAVHQMLASQARAVRSETASVTDRELRLISRRIVCDSLDLGMDRPRSIATPIIRSVTDAFPKMERHGDTSYDEDTPYYSIIENAPDIPGFLHRKRPVEDTWLLGFVHGFPFFFRSMPVAQGDEYFFKSDRIDIALPMGAGERFFFNVGQDETSYYAVPSHAKKRVVSPLSSSTGAAHLNAARFVIDRMKPWMTNGFGSLLDYDYHMDALKAAAEGDILPLPEMKVRQNEAVRAAWEIKRQEDDRRLSYYDDELAGVF